MRTFTLQRCDKNNTGIYSHLYDENGSLLAYTLEHSYVDLKGDFQAKLPTGDYILNLGTHRLADMVPKVLYSFPEVVGYDNIKHVDILIHQGNFNDDSEGCVLIGSDFLLDSTHKKQGVMKSALALHNFMTLCNGDTQIRVLVR